MLFAFVVAVAPNQFAHGGDRGAGLSASSMGPGGTSVQQGEPMKISLKVNGKSLEATLRQGETTRDFVSLLPLTLTMHDLFGRERISQEEHRMAAWSKDELQKMAEADDLHISPFREDGATYGTPTWIWSVAVDGGLYVGGYNGQNSRWYQAAVRQKAGRIRTAGMTKEVAFEAVDGRFNDQIDDAYRVKYRGSPYLAPMIGARARSATVKVMKREPAD